MLELGKAYISLRLVNLSNRFPKDLNFTQCWLENSESRDVQHGHILSTSEVTRFKRLARRSESSRHRVLGPLKKELRAHLPQKRPNFNTANKKKAEEADEPLEDETSLANHDVFGLALDLEALGYSGC